MKPLTETQLQVMRDKFYKDPKFRITVDSPEGIQFFTWLKKKHDCKQTKPLGHAETTL